MPRLLGVCMVDVGLLDLLAGGVATVLWWLLRQKDAAQSRQIDLLFSKHDEDAKALQDLRVQIASQHYVKSELDNKFDRLETTFREGFGSLGKKFDKLSDALTQHVADDNRKAKE